MKRHPRSTNRSKTRLAASIVALIVLIAGAVTVLSRQMDQTAKPGNRKLDAVTDSPMPARASSQDRAVPQATPIQELTPDEARILTDAVKPMVSKSTEGLAESRDADGGVAVDVKDRFQNVTIARRNADGSISYSCVDTPESASAFFQPGRNPDQSVTGTRTTPVRR